MIKIEDYIMDEETLDLYGECEVYSPMDFHEYFDYNERVEEIYSTAESLLSGVYRAILATFPINESEGEGNQEKPLPGEETWGGGIKGYQMQPISREKILFGRRTIKALNQVPFEAMSSLLGRTLMSTDPVASRYVGDGFFGALKYAKDTGKKLSNFAVEMRFLKKGQPKAYIFDPKTKSLIPNMGAIVAPSRAAKLNKVAPNRKGIRNGMPSPNPHQGYLYDGKDDEGNILFNGKGGNIPGYTQGVFVPYRAISKEIGTQLGAPMYHYTRKPHELDYDYDPENLEPKQVPLKKRGKVGTSLEPPYAGDTSTYLGAMPSALGYKPTATQSGSRYRQDDPYNPAGLEQGEGDQDVYYKTGNTGGAGTFDKAWRKWIQAMAEHPGWFDQRTLRYMLYRQRQHQADANTPRANSLAMQPPGTSRNLYTTTANVDAEGNARKRQKRAPVPHDPSRSWVEPARKIPLSPERTQAIAQAMRSNDPNSPIAKRLEDPAFSQPEPQYGNFGKGYEKEPTGEFYTSGRNKGKEKYRRKMEPSGKFDAAGNPIMRSVKQKHMLPMTRRVLPNLYTLYAAADYANPITISAKLAKEIYDSQQKKENPRQVTLRNGDGSDDDNVIQQNYGRNAGEDGGVVYYRVGQKAFSGEGARYFVYPAKDKNRCCWAKTDSHGDVLFLYVQTKSDLEEKEQPILSPGILNTFMGNNPTAYGGIDAAPQGSEERMPYQDKESHARSLYGDPDEEGNYNTNQPLDSANSMGLNVPIQKNIQWGVKHYLETKIDKKKFPDIYARMVQRKGDIVSMATALALQNLANPKMLDLVQGKGTHLNHRYIKAQFSHLHAVLVQLDRIITEANNTQREMEDEENERRKLAGKPQLRRRPPQSGTNVLPSHMTLKELEDYIKSDPCKQLVQKNDIWAKMKNNRIYNTNGQNKKAYPPLVIHQSWTPEGTPAPDGYNHPEGYSKVLVGTPQIEQMIDNARTWYIRFMGKDMARKVYQSEEHAKVKSKLNRGGVFADGVEIGLTGATKAHQAAVAAEHARVSGKGYSRANGQMDRLIEQKRVAPVMIRQEYESAKKEFAANPSDKSLAVKVVRLGMRLDDALIDSKAYAALKEYALELGKDPETGAPLSEDDPEGLKIYILKNLGSWVDKFEKRRDAGTLVLKAATPGKVAVKDPDQIKEGIKARVEHMGFSVKNRELEEVGLNLVEGEDVNDRVNALKYVLALSKGEKYDPSTDETVEIDQDEAYALESIVEYHALESLEVGVHDGTYDGQAINNVRNLVDNLDRAGVMGDFVHAARIILSTKLHGGA